VDDYRVRSVCISPSPPLPDRMQNLGGFFFVLKIWMGWM